MRGARASRRWRRPRHRERSDPGPEWRSRRGWRPTAGLAPGLLLLRRGPGRGRRTLDSRPSIARGVAYSTLGGGGRIDRIGPLRDDPIPRNERGTTVRLLPWEYLFTRFSAHTTPDLYTPFWVATLVLLVVLVILYNVRTRTLHRHAPYLDLYEWLLWSGISLFGLLLVAAVFNFYMVVLLVILVTGLAVMLWIRFIRFPPLLDLYEHKLARH